MSGCMTQTKKPCCAPATYNVQQLEPVAPNATAFGRVCVCPPTLNGSSLRVPAVTSRSTLGVTRFALTANINATSGKANFPTPIRWETATQARVQWTHFPPTTSASTPSPGTHGSGAPIGLALIMIQRSK
jgi:hypothetical protein